MNEIAKQALESALNKALGPDSVYWNKDLNGNSFGWARLPANDDLTKAAAALAGVSARLMVISAYRLDKYANYPGREIAYHFDLDGTVVTVTAHLPTDEDTVPSITRWFQNADWHEREFMELYGIQVKDHPNPVRLFLDPSVEEGALDRLIPLSTMMNGACTKTLWEKVYAGTEMPEWTKGAN